MAEGVTPESRGELEPTRKAELESARSRELTKYSPPVRHGHESRFRLTYAALAGMALAAVIATGVFLVAGKPAKPPAWSKWKPSTSDDGALSQIADHVAPNYRLPTGEQLVAVDGGPPQLAGLPVKILLRPTREEYALAKGKSAMFSLCGLGDKCSIKVGKPSPERTLLMQRESLELALYAFRYVKDVQQVVVLLPPPPGQTPSQAMFFRRNEVKPQLDRPLRFTLPEKAPSLQALRDNHTKALIDRLTGSDVYNFDVIQAPDASVLLELAHFNLKQDTAGASAGATGSSGATATQKSSGANAKSESTKAHSKSSSKKSSSKNSSASP